jgi:hypothetical protein
MIEVMSNYLMNDPLFQGLIGLRFNPQYQRELFSQKQPYLIHHLNSSRLQQLSNDFVRECIIDAARVAKTPIIFTTYQDLDITNPTLRIFKEEATAYFKVRKLQAQSIPVSQK